MREYLKAIKVSDSVYWVGAIDWSVRNFHGYHTGHGTTYNAYLILADKVTLVDTVRRPFKSELLSRIRSVIDPEKIDYIVSNHSELDHSGCIDEMIKECKPEKVFASKMGVKALGMHFDLNQEIEAVKSGDEIDLGNMSLSVIETKMLHWPDSMFTYLKEEQVLFSQDAFGLHLATDKIFVDENSFDRVYDEMKSYYANIITLYSGKVLKLLEDVAALNLPLKLIASDHGPIWRKDFDKVFEYYHEWASQKPQPKAVLIYDTMWGSTAAMAASVTDGLMNSDIKVEVLPLSGTHRSQVAAELIDAGALIVGSPTLNNNIYPTVADVLTYLKGLKFKNLIVAAFGSHGWSGEGVKLINEILDGMDLERVSDGVRCQYVATEEVNQECHELGMKVGQLLKEKVASNQ